MENERLTKESQWDQGYADRMRSDPFVRSETYPALKSVILNCLGKTLHQYSLDYSDYLLWDVIFPKYLPRLEGANILEIGSAPGDFLIQMALRHKVNPYGVEYTQNGVAINRKLFEMHNLQPENIFNADLFDSEFQEQHRSSFDVVISRGFIEHFTNMNEVMDAHLNLLKQGGYLVVSVPNFRGIYYLWIYLFRRSVLEWHNLDVMELTRFRRLFLDRNLSTSYCSYYGTVSLSLCNGGDRPIVRIFARLLHLLQRCFNVILRFVFRKGGVESKFFSPYLLYIGVKNGNDC